MDHEPTLSWDDMPSAATLLSVAVNRLAPGCRLAVSIQMEKPSGALIKTKIIADFPDVASAMIFAALAEALGCDLGHPNGPDGVDRIVVEIPGRKGSWPGAVDPLLGLN